jgi:hypothetical protein
VLVAVVAAAALPCFATTAYADVMAPGTYEGQITGGTLSLGDGDFHTTPITVPAGGKFTFTIPAGASAPVGWTAPGIHVDIPVRSEAVSGTVFSAGGTIDLSSLSGTVNPATGATTATGSAHGVFHLNTWTASSSAGSSVYCYFGNPAAPPSAPDVPAPTPLNLAGTGTITDSTFAAVVDCADALPPVASLGIIGSVSMPANGNTLSLATTFTRQPDPQPTIQVVTQTITKTVTVTPPPANCVVPKLKGLKLAKARAAVTKANCAVGKVTRKKSSQKKTVVLKQGKKAGAVLAHGSKITLTIAR